MYNGRSHQRPASSLEARWQEEAGKSRGVRTDSDEADSDEAAAIASDAEGEDPEADREERGPGEQAREKQVGRKRARMKKARNRQMRTTRKVRGVGGTARPEARKAPARRDLADADYAALAAWRYALRRFLSASEAITRTAGVSPTQYQLLLFVKSFPAGQPSIADLAERLQIRHQSAVGLVDRCEEAGLVRRERDPANGRRVLVEMTARGASLLRRLASAHFATIESLGLAFSPPFSGGQRRPGSRRADARKR